MIKQHITQDKLGHFAAGVVIFAALHFIVPVHVAFSVVVITAFAKEAWDKRGHGTFDGWDMVATIAGGVVGVICGL